MTPHEKRYHLLELDDQAKSRHPDAVLSVVNGVVVATSRYQFDGSSPPLLHSVEAGRHRPVGGWVIGTGAGRSSVRSVPTDRQVKVGKLISGTASALSTPVPVGPWPSPMGALVVSGGSRAQQCLDCAAFIHGAVAFGDLVE